MVDRAKPGRDTVAVELRLRSYDKRRRTARFVARTLGSLGGGLRHINRRLDRRPPRRFAGASLFIDNADYYSGEVCTIGQLKLMAYNPAYAADPPVLPEGMLAANGEILSVNDNAALYSVLGIAFGGDGFSTFALPDISAPPDLGWFICSDGLFPRRGQLTPCVPGEVDYWTMTGGFSDPRWLPADGRTVPASLYPAYASASGTGDATLQLPDVPAPEGMEALVCVDNEGEDLPGPTLGQVDLFPGPPPQGAGSWLPAAGQVVPTSANSGLYPLLYVYSRNPIVNAFAPNPPPTFQLPAPEAPGPGLEYYINSNGAWPLQFE